MRKPRTLATNIACGSLLIAHQSILIAHSESIRLNNARPSEIDIPDTVLNTLLTRCHLNLTVTLCTRQVQLSFPFYRSGNWGPERFSSSPKVTQQVRARVKTIAFYLQSLHSTAIWNWLHHQPSFVTPLSPTSHKATCHSAPGFRFCPAFLISIASML